MSDHKPIRFETIAQMPERVISQTGMRWNKTGTWRYLRPLFQDRVPPCHPGCPAGNDIEGFIRRIDRRQWIEAGRLLREENPFSRVCGRVCYHPCESVCNRSELDHAIAIHALERFAADAAAESPAPVILRPASGRTVAIIGSGPAGLTAAYHLARMGHGVTVFEAAAEPGGLMRYGIPAYRLPNAVLDDEIGRIVALGVDIRCGQRVGTNPTWSALTPYDAVFIAVGVYDHRQLNIEGEAADGVITGLALLAGVARQEPPELGPRTIVIGGGNSAIDSARSALRLGSQATIYYQRSRREMPAFEEELIEAEREGVKIHYLTQPVKILTQANRVVGVRLRRTRLGDPDASGRRRPEPIIGSEFEVSADTIVTAIGETAALGFLPKSVEREWGRLKTDRYGRTTVENVFAGGDAALEEHNVAVAIGSGKIAACAIDAFLAKKDPSVLESNLIARTGAISVARYLNQGEAHIRHIGSADTVSFSELNLHYFEPQARSKIAKLGVPERQRRFDEINLGFTELTAQTEAARCFHCGTCIGCDNCYVFCPDVAVVKRASGRTLYEIDLDYCKGCGVCVNECPRAAMCMEEEQ
jgi:NADPH-dependent glutamate synthase beta subunit-like oxidoreductase